MKSLIILLLIATITFGNQEFSDPPEFFLPQEIEGYPKVEKNSEAVGSEQLDFEIHYDRYGRAIKVVEIYILGYWSESDYEYHDKNYRFEDGDEYYWRSVLSKEHKKFYDGNNETIAYAIKTFDTQENELTYESEGFGLVISIIQFMAGILGIETPDIME